MLKFGRQSFCGTCDNRYDFRIKSTRESHVATCPSTIAKVQRASSFLCNEVKYCDVTLEFGRDIGFVANVITEMISELHL